MMDILDKRNVRCTLLILVFATLMPSILNACGHCFSTWKMVFETGADGSVVMGNKWDLVDAALKGARVRFLLPTWYEGGYAGEFDYVRSFKTVDQISVVCGQSLMHVGRNGWDTFVDDAYWRFLYICTTGYVHEVGYAVGASIARGENTSQINVQWFVMEPANRNPVYSHLADGTAVSGSKDDLINAVVSGYDVGLVYGNETSITHQNVDISGNGEVGGQHIWQLLASYEKGRQIFLKAALWLFTMWNTNGFVEGSVWVVGEHFTLGKALHHASLDWNVDACWCHVFTHDENGNHQRGSLGRLISDVESGYRVKVVLGNYSIEVDNVRTNNGQVSAQLLNHVSKKETFSFADDAFWYWQMVHTTGTVQTRRYFIGNVTNAGDTLEKKPISWFVDTQTWNNVLSTKANGEVKSGSKTDLRNAIQNGASVRVAQKSAWSKKASGGWFVMKADDLVIGPSGEVSAQLIKSVSTVAVGSEEFQIRDDPFWRFMIVTTQSRVHVSQWRVGAHINDGHFAENKTVNWFVSY